MGGIPAPHYFPAPGALGTSPTANVVTPGTAQGGAAAAGPYNPAGPAPIAPAPAPSPKPKLANDDDYTDRYRRLVGGMPRWMER